MTEKTQTPFRVGGVYRQRDGAVMLVCSPLPGWEDGSCQVKFAEDYAPYNATVGMSNGLRWLATGGLRNRNETLHDLLPGELHQVDGQWVALEEKKEDSFCMSVGEAASIVKATPEFTGAMHFADAEMIARDGQAKPQADWNPIYLQPAPKSTAKPALSALLLCADLEPRGYLR